MRNHTAVAKTFVMAACTLAIVLLTIGMSVNPSRAQSSHMFGAFISGPSNAVPIRYDILRGGRTSVIKSSFCNGVIDPHMCMGHGQYCYFADACACCSGECKNSGSGGNIGKCTGNR
jgi:hypothetical protein